MGRANSPSSRSELKTSNLWCPSAIPAWGCPRSRQTRSSMRSLPRSFMGPVWDCPSAAPSLNRIAAACGLPTTLRAAQVFTSFYPPKSRQMNDADVRAKRFLRRAPARKFRHAAGEISKILAHVLERKAEREEALNGLAGQFSRQALAAHRSELRGVTVEG